MSAADVPLKAPFPKLNVEPALPAADAKLNVPDCVELNGLVAAVDCPPPINVLAVPKRVFEVEPPKILGLLNALLELTGTLPNIFEELVEGGVVKDGCCPNGDCCPKTGAVEAGAANEPKTNELVVV